MVPIVSRTIKRGSVPLLVLCLAIGFIPIPYLAAPQWDVWVKDETEVPMPAMYVRLSSKNYSAKSESHEMTLTTDKMGHVSFPSQYRAASMLQRAFYSGLSALEGVHASFGNHAFVFVFGGGYEGEAVTGNYVTDWTGSPTKMTSTIIAKRMQDLH